MKILLFIIVLALSLRLYGLNWDQGNHLHPDERAIIMTAASLSLPQNFPDFFSPASPWNPHFFPYGSFPLYFLRIAGAITSIFNPLNGSYDQINLVGRVISAFFDTFTLVLIFHLGKKIFNKKIGILSAFLYAISVLPIQLSHFYAVDTMLNFFILATICQLLKFYEKPTIKRSAFMGIFFGFAIATKISAVVLLSSLGFSLIIDFLLIFLKNPHHPHIWFPHVPKFLKRLFINGVIILISTFTTFTILEPYALIDFNNFLRQNMEQYNMTHDAFTFPYTLQYVSKIPYLYELRNIFFWGLGPLLATLAFMGTVYVSSRLIVKHLEWWQADPERSRGRSHDSSEVELLIILAFFWSYFLIVGNFAVGFMRYMLPLYPFLCLFAAFFAYQIFLILKSLFLNHKLPLLILYSLFFILLMAWPLSFINIYTKPNTRTLATEWINQNIPRGSSIATEHWDDGLPIGTQSNYKVYELPMYEFDENPIKWEKVNLALTNADYIIIASNRLYVPLQKLTDCANLPPGRCYTKTAKYYQDLFGEKLGFKKIAEFSTYPELKIKNLKLIIDDSSADESFTVYDHPKIIIFKKKNV